MKKRILSIDGGGIRGVIPATLLVIFEKKLRERFGDDAHIADYFDLFTGTSTGAIIICGMLTPNAEDRPLWRAKDIQDVYLNKGNQIFSRSLKHIITSLGGLRDERYDGVGLMKILTYYFGTTTLSELLKPTLIPTYELGLRSGFLFRSHRAEDPAYNFPITDVTRATSAAPTYFEPARVTAQDGAHYSCIDGGTIINNPAVNGFVEARTLWGIHTDEMAILSLGTGEDHTPLHYKDFKDRGLLQWMKPLIDIMMDGSMRMADYQLRNMFDGRDVADQYLRMETGLAGASPEMDDISQDNIDALHRLAIEKGNSEEMQAKMERFLDFLAD